MTNKGISIHWDGGIEYIPIDPNSISTESEVRITSEYWPSSEAYTFYVTTSEVSKDGDTYILKINYKHSLNQHISHSDAYWGTSIIYILHGAISGKVEWQDSNNPKNNNYKTWDIIDNDLYKLPAKETITRIKRNQAKLRKALLAADAFCAITGEKTIEALEAAHIIPSANSGAEVVQNSILLRSDIHKLLDKNLFSISDSGQIINISRDLSEYYRTLLTKKRCIDRNAFERVALALAVVLALSN